MATMTAGTRRNARLAIALAAYIASIVIANVLVDLVGLVPIGFGLVVPAGTFAAGAALILRDAVQVYGQRWHVFAAILAGAAISYYMSSPAIAVASGLAFLISELVDYAVFTPLRGRSLPMAVVVSSLVSAPVDTVLFLWISGLGVSWSAVIGQLLVKTLLALLVAAYLAYRRTQAGVPGESISPGEAALPSQAAARG